MILDAIGILLTIIFFVRGYMKGIVVAAFSLLSIVLGIALSLKLSERLASFLLERQIVTTAWSQPVSYIAIFLGVVILIRLAAKAVQTSLDVAMLGWINKLAGGLLYTFIIAMIWSSLLWIADKMQLITATTISQSVTYPYFSKLAPWVINHLGDWLPVAKNIFNDLELFFKKVNGYVDTHR